MRATGLTDAIPPGFARPLTVGEVPLMACSDHNRPLDAPASRTYRMLLPSSQHDARGYHSLRFLRLRRIHLKQRWQTAIALLLLSCVGFFLIFWSQLGILMLNLVQNVYLRSDFDVTEKDVSRCKAGGLPIVYHRGDLVSWEGLERSEWLKEMWQTNSTFAPRKLSYATYVMTMALVETVTRSFSEENVEAVLVSGSLVGSYLFHDLLPWGRVVSLAVRAADKEKVQNILNTMDVSEAIGRNVAYPPADFQTLSASKARLQVTEASKGAKWRVTLNSPAAMKETLSALRIHIHWWTADNVEAANTSADDVTEDTRAVILQADSDDEKDGPLQLPVSQWQPFERRPLGLLLLPAPLNPRFYINRRYHVSDPYCAARHFSQGIFLSYFRGSCGIVRNAYPHIERIQITDHCVREVVISNNKVDFVAYVAGRD